MFDKGSLLLQPLLEFIKVAIDVGKTSHQATPSSAYSMAKGRVHALTQHMAMELADHNIRVNAVSPAVVKTPILRGFHRPKSN